jgi:starvation-inducible DNA-binding protein
MIAERVTLGGTPTHVEDYIKHNKIVVGKNISNDEKQFN